MARRRELSRPTDFRTVLRITTASILAYILTYISYLRYINPLYVIRERQKRLYFVDSTGKVVCKPGFRQQLLDLFQSDASVRRKLLTWVKEQIPGLRLENLSTCWQDGIALCSLMESVSPGACPRHELLKPHHRVNNCRLGLKLAQKHLNLPQGIITPEEMAIADQKTEPKIRQLLTFIKWASAKTEDGVAYGDAKRPAYVPSSGSIDRMTKNCSVKGNGLMMGVVGKRCKFYIYTEPHAMLDLQIEIKGPRNEICSEKIMSIYPTRRMSQLLTADDVNVSMTNDVKYVDDGKGNAYFRQKSIENVDEEEKKIPFDYQSLGKGKYVVSYVPRSSGEHKISVISYGNHIAGSPFIAKVAESVGHLEKQFSRDQRVGIFFGKASDSVDSGRSIDSFERDNPPDLTCYSVPRTTGSAQVTHQPSMGTLSRSVGLNGRLSKQGTVTRRRVLRRVVTRGGNEVSLDESGRYTALNRQSALSTHAAAAAKTPASQSSTKNNKTGGLLEVPDKMTKRLSEKCPPVAAVQSPRKEAEVKHVNNNNCNNKNNSDSANGKDHTDLHSGEGDVSGKLKLTEAGCAKTESYAQSMVNTAMQSAYDSLQRRRCSRQKCVDFPEGLSSEVSAVENFDKAKVEHELKGADVEENSVEPEMDTSIVRENKSGNAVPPSISSGYMSDDQAKYSKDIFNMAGHSGRETLTDLEKVSLEKATYSTNRTNGSPVIPTSSSNEISESPHVQLIGTPQEASDGREIIPSSAEEPVEPEGPKLSKQMSCSTKTPPESPSLKLLQSESLHKVCYYISQRAITHSIQSLQSQASESNLLVINAGVDPGSMQRGRIMGLSEDPSVDAVDVRNSAADNVFAQTNNVLKKLSCDESMGMACEVDSASSAKPTATVIVVPASNRRRGSLVRQDVTLLQKVSEESSAGSEKSLFKENQQAVEGRVRLAGEEINSCLSGIEKTGRNDLEEGCVTSEDATLVENKLQPQQTFGDTATKSGYQIKVTEAPEGDDAPQRTTTTLGCETGSSQKERQLSWSSEKGSRHQRCDSELDKLPNQLSNHSDGEKLPTTTLSAFSRQTQQSLAYPSHSDEGFNTIVDIRCHAPSSPTWYSSQIFIRIPTPKIDKWTQITYEEIKQETGWVSPRSSTRQRKTYKLSGHVELSMEPQHCSSMDVSTHCMPPECGGARSPLSVWYGDNLPQIVYEPASEVAESNSFMGSDHSHYNVHQWLQDNREEMSGLQPVRQSTVETVDSGIADSRCSSPGRLWRRQRHSVPNLNGHRPVCRHPYQGQIELDPRLLRSASNSPSGDEEKENLCGRQRKNQIESVSRRQICRTTSDGKRPRKPRNCPQDSCSLSDTELCKCASPGREDQDLGLISGEEKLPSAHSRNRDKHTQKDDKMDRIKVEHQLKSEQQMKKDIVGTGLTASQCRKMKFRRRSFALVDSDSQCSIDKDCVDSGSLSSAKVCTSKNRQNEGSSLINGISASAGDMCDVSARRRSYGGTPTAKKREIQMQRSSTLKEESYYGFGLSMSHRDDLLSQINVFSNLYEKHVDAESDSAEIDPTVTTPEKDTPTSPSGHLGNLGAWAGDSRSELMLTSDSDFLEGSLADNCSVSPLHEETGINSSLTQEKELCPQAEGEDCESSNPIRELFDMLVRYQEDLTSASDDGDLGLEPIEAPHSSYSDSSRCRAIGPGLETGTVGTKLFFQVITEGAGNGYLTVGIKGPSAELVGETSVIYSGDNRYEVAYEVASPGYYAIYVKWSDESIPNSPFVVRITF